MGLIRMAGGAQIAETLAVTDATDVTALTGTGTTIVMQGSPTITTPRIVTTGYIADGGGDEYLLFVEGTTPVTYVQLTSGNTGVAPSLIGAGETNIGLLLAGSGTGKVRIGDGADNTKLLTIELVGATTAKTMTFTCSHTDDRTLTFPDATDTLVGQATTDTLTNKTLTSPQILTSLVFDETTNDLTVTADDQAIGAGTLNFPDIGGVGAGAVVAAAIKFDASAGGAAGTHTGTVELPAGAVLLNIQVVTTVLWDSGTSATLIVGDDDDDNGWFENTNVKATDLAVGEVMDISNAENWGALQGVYLVAATGRKGRVTAGVDSGVYYGAATEVVGKITTVGSSTVGTTYMIVTYMKPTQTAAAYVAT